MKPAPFTYHDPSSVAEAAELLGRLENTRPLAGGQSLVPMMNFRFVTPDHIIDLNGVAELSGVSIGDDRMTLGAMTRQRDVEFSADVARHCPVIIEALLNVGHRQTRNRGTIGGSLCHLDPAAEMPAMMTLLDATLEARSHDGGARDISMRDFALGYMTTALAPEELLTRISAPLWPSDHGYAFEEFARRHGDFAIASAGVLIALDARGAIERLAIVVSGLGATPTRLDDVEAAAVGETPTEEIIKAAVDAAKQVEAMDDAHVTATYRQHIAGVMCARAARRAFQRARERSLAHA